jgi:putative NADPH-quinone reductase
MEPPVSVSATGSGLPFRRHPSRNSQPGPGEEFLAYGGTTFPHKQVWMLGVAGNHLESYTKRGYDAAMKTSLDLGILNFCGIERTRLELLHGAIEGTEFPQQLLKRSWELAQQFSADAKAAKSA